MTLWYRPFRTIFMFTCRWTFFRMIDSRTYILIWRLYRFKRIYAFRCPPYSNTILRLFDFGLHLRIILRPRYILWWFFKLNKKIFTRYSLPNLTWALFGLRQASESRTLIWISMTLHGLFIVDNTNNEPPFVFSV